MWRLTIDFSLRRRKHPLLVLANTLSMWMDQSRLEEMLIPRNLVVVVLGMICLSIRIRGEAVGGLCFEWKLM